MNATCRFIVGDSLTVLRTLPDTSVDLVLFSPPFLGLRSYLPADHPDKASEIGSERTPGEFIDTLLDIVEECARVLAPHGSLCLELGDTYSGSGGAGGDYNANGLREGQPRFRQGYVRIDHPRDPAGQGEDYGTPETFAVGAKGGAGWPLSKSLCLIPELLRFSLAYGFNPLTGRETERWRVRNVVQWCRPNPPVGALGDKFRPATSDLLVACKSRTRYFDLDSCRGPVSPNAHARTAKGVDSRPTTGKNADDGGRRGGSYSSLTTLHETGGAPPLDWWEIPTQGFPGAHFATFPKALCVRPILSMCPERVCRKCGEPSRRIVGEVTYERDGAPVGAIDPWPWGGNETGRRGARKSNDGGLVRSAPTIGWTDCGCVGDERWRPGVVLDPFGGSGTTGVVAHGHGRSSVLIDIDARNVELARGRLGMFLEDEVVA